MHAPNLKILDGSDLQDPEVLAMLQAFYSRSPMPIEDRLKSLTEESDAGTKTERIRQALKTYYVDYGHASIGECGFITVFIENVSLLAAKAFQDTPLYVGQECSTRYIKFDKQPFVSHLRGDHSNEVLKLQEAARSVYLKALAPAVEFARAKYSAKDVVSNKIPSDRVPSSYEKTLIAIGFDICRGLLPAGVTTSLAWTGSFRTFNDHLRLLVSHPLAEVRSLAKDLYFKLSQRYPSSFKNEVLVESLNPVFSREADYNKRDDRAAYVESSWVPCQDTYYTALASRQRGTDIRGRKLTDNVQYYSIRGKLDFGSHRDLQRHRNGYNHLPQLTTLHGVNSFYLNTYSELDRFSPGLYEEILCLFDDVHNMNAREGSTPHVVPLAFNVPVSLHWSNGQLEYVLKLRTSTSVHPTLREFMWAVEADAVTHAGELSSFWQVNTDNHYSASDRGEQDIKSSK